MSGHALLEWSAVRYRDNEMLPSGRWGHSLTVVTPRYFLVIGGEWGGVVATA